MAGVAPREAGVVAIVLTHNAPDSLERCLDAIASQTHRPDAVFVVDNASTPPARAEGIGEGTEEGTEERKEPAGAMPVRILRSAVNTGPAGGYHQGLAALLDSDYDHAWVLDDDMVPEPTCLERLWAVAAADPKSAFVFPMSRQSDGSVGVWPSWCGFVIARHIVCEVGLPLAELFWWAEDTEYLQWRIPEAGYPWTVVPGALVNHDAVRQGGGVPLWKYYYEARNMLYVHLHVKRKVGRYPKNMTKLVARALLRERGGRVRRVGVMARGMWDGAWGRLGMQFPVEPMRERPPGPGGLPTVGPGA